MNQTLKKHIKILTTATLWTFSKIWKHGQYTRVILDTDVQYQSNPMSHLGDTASDGQTHTHARPILRFPFGESQRGIIIWMQWFDMRLHDRMFYKKIIKMTDIFFFFDKTNVCLPHHFLWSFSCTLI